MSFTTYGSDSIIASIPIPQSGNIPIWNASTFAWEAGSVSSAPSSVVLPFVTPSPSGSGVTLFADQSGDLYRVQHLDPLGYTRSLQSALSTNNIAYLRPTGNGTTVSSIGINNTITGTATARNVAATSLFTSLRRVGFVSSTTTGSSAGTRHGAQQYFRSNGNALVGGYHAVFTFGVSQYQAGMAIAVGMHNGNATFSNADPSTFPNVLLLGKDPADTNMQILHNDGTGNCTKINLGANFPATTANTDVYQLTLYTPPNGTRVSWKVVRLNTGDTTQGIIETDQPGGTALLSPQAWVCNRATAAAVAIDVIQIYIETDN